MNDQLIPPILLFSLSILILFFLALLGKRLDAWLNRILDAFAASGLSVVIPGTITIDTTTNNNLNTFVQASPNLTATSAMAIFVLVYLFNPLKN
ncbi:hypothetical protein [Winogradskyella sp.]|uniref:hypothetical protein n=1 Tax=Winogradskyella sp. TaxID=1883156 RepID=UPI003BAD5E21